MSHLIASYGYVALFCLVGIESLGVPLPGETALIAAGLYAGSTHHLAVAWVVAVAAGAGIIGDNIGFWIGDKGGSRLLERYGNVVHLNEERRTLGRYLFRRHGGAVVFLGRFVSVLRTYAAFLAGANGMPWRRFLVFNAAGATIWATLFGVGSYTLGNTIKTISSTLTWVMVGVAVVVIGIGVSVTRRHEARLIATAHDYLAAEDSGHKSEQPGTEESIRTVDPRS